jgi:hypothetical protein
MAKRPEVTGGKPVTTCPVPRGAYNIKQFCQAHSIGVRFYFKLKRMGLGPDETQLGKRVLITVEAAARWRAAREAATKHFAEAT